MERFCALIFTMILVTACLAGCEPKTQHKVLTFFFTGVQPLGDKKTVDEPEMQTTSVKARERLPLASGQILYSHPLWIKGACDPCHETTSTFSIPGVEEKSTRSFKSGGGNPGPLTLPKTKLCTQCHKDKIPKRALAENLWLHNTTAKGDCLACHDPHQSVYEKGLRRSSAVICFLVCHEKGNYLSTPAHEKGEECLTCHNPHMGVNKNLLTKEYKEIKKPVTEVVGHPEWDRH